MLHYDSAHFDARSDDTTSLAEILGAFSYALDLTEGQPAGHSLRACWIASRMAVALRLPAADRRTVYYATLLKDLGCSSNAAPIAELYLADDRKVKQERKLLAVGLGPTLRYVFTRTGQDQRLGARLSAKARCDADRPRGADHHRVRRLRCANRRSRLSRGTAGGAGAGYHGGRGRQRDRRRGIRRLAGNHYPVKVVSR